MTPTPHITFKALTQFFMLSVGLMLMSAGASSNERPPNIVLLIGDDHGAVIAKRYGVIIWGQGRQRSITGLGVIGAGKV